MSGNVIDFSSVAASVTTPNSQTQLGLAAAPANIKTPDLQGQLTVSSASASVATPNLQAQLTLANASANVIVAAVGMQGPAGSARNVTQEFTAGAGGYTVAMAAAIGAWHALFVSGIRQQPSSYSVSGTSLIIPTGLTYAGAVCCFDYLPA